MHEIWIIYWCIETAHQIKVYSSVYPQAWAWSTDKLMHRNNRILWASVPLARQVAYSKELCHCFNLHLCHNSAQNQKTRWFHQSPDNPQPSRFPLIICNSSFDVYRLPSLPLLLFLPSMLGQVLFSHLNSESQTISISIQFEDIYFLFKILSSMFQRNSWRCMWVWGLPLHICLSSGFPCLDFISSKDIMRGNSSYWTFFQTCKCYWHS